MHLLDALKQAGRNGVVTRQNRTDVIVVRSLEPDPGRAVLIQISDDRFGNWEPTEEDLGSADWLVVAKSIWGHR